MVFRKALNGSTIAFVNGAYVILQSFYLQLILIQFRYYLIVFFFCQQKIISSGIEITYLQEVLNSGYFTKTKGFVQ